MEQPLPAERHRRIQELLQERRALRVSTLAEMLGVSEVTVRRDLEALERRGLLERTHGGAVQARRMGAEPPYLEAVSSHPREKSLIGRAAASLVEPGDALFMNGGSTTLEVFRRLDARRLKVVTNHIGMALELGERDIDLLLVGGTYREPSNSTVGPLATDALRRIHANRAFIGVEGLSLRSGLTTPAAAEAEIARLMIEQTRGEVTVVADSSKCGIVADFVITQLDRIDRLVVDSAIDDEFREGLSGAGVEVMRADVPVAVPPDDG